VDTKEKLKLKCCNVWIMFNRSFSAAVAANSPLPDMKQQTAVEWYYEQTIVQGKTNYAELLEQALTMEKEQIKDVWMDGMEGILHEIAAEKYYNETYGKDSTTTTD